MTAIAMMMCESRRLTARVAEGMASTQAPEQTVEDSTTAIRSHVPIPTHRDRTRCADIQDS
ncbi:hypothetical protein GCM10011610_69610 [Nocardia rhizosphaerihabitans]|uniref:Uncharacterized protein n=1 Tax=Nocardia rhizosphaerihabitans TaxID=1691570 RepID=A0ABQ2L2S5_9NOCA|nr:hypothetical protein GCM10011610_69610 [Nocardia rhizosphaerihabitans]